MYPPLQCRTGCPILYLANGLFAGVSAIHRPAEKLPTAQGPPPDPRPGALIPMDFDDTPDLQYPPRMIASPGLTGLRSPQGGWSSEVTNSSLLPPPPQMP